MAIDIPSAIDFVQAELARLADPDKAAGIIRKAIGWALREYAKTDGQAVADFAARHRDALSGLSYREATKHIGHLLGN